MNPEEIKALKELIEFLQEKKIGEFRLERGELKVELKFEAAMIAAAAQNAPHPAQQMDPLLLARLLGGGAPAPAAAAAPASPAPPVHELTAQPAAAEAAEEVLHTVKSPIVGTFYESPSPGSAAFVKIGDMVEVAQPICIVEAMKLMNEIESDVAGEIVKRLVQNGQPVEYGQPLFAVRVR
ncbi:acetyl-CoA carboxylase biotin carboxyl carrier protein [Acidipila sp. EB88]|uniref:acetyl-CoA carboxylase biotin carboxyl carrier protein n=1 Tax=Acidipila sp. EB88 TaxID=2305226 RepID=UPI000F5EADA5|nr:acetyl-CoA carboxylase biotin carboxyl carrier protein [Acidipila sp. EB88]RRA49740.1 acetyl-CoA carboxylase biotin carboxyl carrier protein [Acidipila sp. EB88]